MKALIATSYPAFRRSIAALLRASYDIDVLGEADDGAAALRLLHADAWDIALLGIRLPVGGGLHFLRLFKAERPTLPVVMVCFEEHPLATVTALNAGACGYVMRDSLAQELVPSVRAALAGEIYQSTAMTRVHKT